MFPMPCLELRFARHGSASLSNNPASPNQVDIAKEELLVSDQG